MLKLKISGLPLRGFHEYKKTLTRNVEKGDKLKLKIESQRFHGTSTFPVAATRHKNGISEKIGQIPKEFSWCFKVILRADPEKCYALVAKAEPVQGIGEEIICNFFIHAADSTRLRNALDSLHRILQNSCWDFYKPSILQLVNEGNKQVIKPWCIEADDNAKQEQDKFPEELKDDPLTRQQFEKAISEGVECDKSMRIMVIGCYGQGKTSLVRKLLKEKVSDVNSTNGIDVINFGVKEDYSWERRSVETDVDTDAARRLAAVNYPMDKKGKDNEFTAVRKPYKVHSSTDTETQVCVKKMKVEASCSFSDNVSEGISDSGSQGATSQSSSFNSDLFKRYSSVVSNSSLLDIKNTSVSGSVWDFGGQFIFYATHQLFHSRQAIYLLVFDLSKGLEDIIEDEDFPNKKNEKTLKDYIRFWVNSVHCFVGSNDGEEPQIILVGTHSDKLNADQDVDEYFEEVRSIFDDSTQIKHIYPKHFAVSNTEHDTSDILELSETLTKLGQQLANERTSLPAKWILLEKVLKEKQHEKITSFDNILAINKEIQFPLENQEEVKLFLKLHHSRGSLFHFNDKELSEYVVLDPQYLIDAFKCIITSKKFCLSHTKFRNAWRRLCEDAILEKILIEELWQRNPGTNFMQHEKVLLGCLQRHRIIGPVLKYNETMTLFNNLESIECYIVPSLLKVRPSARLLSSFVKGKALTKVALVYEFENESIVETIFHRFTAAALGKWPPLKFEKQSLLFESMCIFEILDHAGLIKLRDGMLELLVLNLCPPEQISSKVCDLFRCFFEEVVSSEFHKLEGIGDPGSPGKKKLYTNSVRCFDEIHEINGSDNVYTFQKIQNSTKTSFPCPDKHSHSLKFQDVFDTWYNTEEVDTVPKRTLTSKECAILSNEIIGSGWDLLANKLGLSKVEVDHINEDFRRTAQKISEVLRIWQQREDDNATFDVLVSAIRRIRPSNLTVDEDKLKSIIHGLC